MVVTSPSEIKKRNGTNKTCFFLLSFSRGRTDGRQGLSKPNLSSREIDEMIDDWTPEPLVPPLSEEETAEAEAMPVRTCTAVSVYCTLVVESGSFSPLHTHIWHIGKYATHATAT